MSDRLRVLALVHRDYDFASGSSPRVSTCTFLADARVDLVLAAACSPLDDRDAPE